jgi:hypothetical protein
MADQGPVEDVKRMLGVTYSGGKYHVSINPSSLGVIQACPRKAQYVLHDKLVPNERGAALTFGTAIHAALEVFYSEPRDSRVLVPNFKNNIMLMCQGQTLPDESSSFIYRATRRFIEEAKPLADLPDSDKRSLFNGGWLLGEYFEVRINDPYEIMFQGDEPMAELLIEGTIVDKPDLKIDLFGTVDCILENKANGQVVVCDHKTSSVVGNGFYNRTKPNHQYTSYIWLAQNVLGINTDNFMINCFNVKVKPKTTRGTGPNFLHLITKRTPEDIEEFTKTLEYYVRQYISWTEDGFFPVGPVDACANYGQCSFLDVCQSPSSIRPNILKMNYKETQ